MVGTMAPVPQVVDAVRVPVIARPRRRPTRGLPQLLHLVRAAHNCRRFLGCPDATVAPLHRSQLRRAQTTARS